MKGLTKFLTYVFALLLCAAAAGAVAYFVLQEKGVSFSVTQDGQRFYSGTEYEELCIPAGATYDFTVQSLVGESVDYSVKITANAEQSFDFTMDGDLYRFYGGKIRPLNRIIKHIPGTYGYESRAVHEEDLRIPGVNLLHAHLAEARRFCGGILHAEMP